MGSTRWFCALQFSLHMAFRGQAWHVAPRFVPAAPACATGCLGSRPSQLHHPRGQQSRAESRRRLVVKAMFSGIVEEMGTVHELADRLDMVQWDGTIGRGVELSVNAQTALEGASLGCSIAVNGVCLTVTEFTDGRFKVGLAEESLRRSNLGDLKPGDPVNLERALPAEGRNSGHFVQGHVDATGTIQETWREGDSLWIRVKAPADVMRYVVPKGFIAVDGTSLTVCETDPAAGWFTFMLVAYTQQHIILPKKNVGDKVNLEVDVLGKYVERSLGSVLERLAAVEDQLKGLAVSREADGTQPAGPPAGPPAAADPASAFASRLDKLEKRLKDFSMRKVEDQVGAVEFKVKNRDLIIESLEERLNKLERAAL